MQKGIIGLALGAAAAYGAYRFYKMTPEQKRNLREKGKNFVDKNFGRFSKKASTANNGH
jgi:hypothetical protein